MIMRKNISIDKSKAYFHLPGLFEFYELYKALLPIYRNHREYFYENCEIGSIYGAPAECIWGGGRTGFGEWIPDEVLELTREYDISARLTFSNSLLKSEHLADKKCNKICEMFENNFGVQNSTHNGTHNSVRNGVIVHSELLLDYLMSHYPELYFVSSTTKVLTEFEDFVKELKREEFDYVVPDFRLNKSYDRLGQLSEELKAKTEFLCNECCYFGCTDRRTCYENVSRKNLGEDCEDHICKAPNSGEGYKFSKAMMNPGFIGIDDIQNKYLKLGFNNFKIEGRGLGSAVVLEFILYYMVKPEYHINVREDIYLDSMLDIF